MHQNMIGILLSAKMHRGIPQGRTAWESLSFYEKSARKYGLIPCYLQLKDIDLESGTCLAYMPSGTEYQLVRLKIPLVIHNRAIYKDPAAIQKLQRLLARGVIVFNSNNRYGKQEIYNLLSKDPELASCLPMSHPANSASMQMMMHRYKDLILKPDRGSVGRGIYRLQKAQYGWKLVYPEGRKRSYWKEQPLRQGALPGWLIRRFSKTPYLVQQRLDLAEVDGRPFDLRVTVQRGLHGSWGITGMFAKLSAPGRFLSNIAQGGTPYPAELLIKQALPSTAAVDALERTRSLALAAASRLSHELPILADLGIDIGITQDGQAYIIECNGRDQRYGFRQAGMTEAWEASYDQPMSYAAYLLQLIRE
ncbi:hypothetical protein DCC85_17610 [Paenibacillus sp. CAA11]|uniref:YheC/YheD family endospore coat-associated protein n=1 Tax=Paenibacillus sp. CAA11 TaxID=1532905 RepID=UPI000D363AEA|nr:YheC/YheD family protein [Paenibacillus sp. CAA11]AWB45821.1 hypothetical protein DCC85_17610 [Paenibacillus sp. CAA11]